MPDEGRDGRAAGIFVVGDGAETGADRGVEIAVAVEIGQGRAGVVAGVGAGERIGHVGLVAEEGHRRFARELEVVQAAIGLAERRVGIAVGVEVAEGQAAARAGIDAEKGIVDAAAQQEGGRGRQAGVVVEDHAAGCDRGGQIEIAVAVDIGESGNDEGAAEGGQRIVAAGALHEGRHEVVAGVGEETRPAGAVADRRVEVALGVEVGERGGAGVAGVEAGEGVGAAGAGNESGGGAGAGIGEEKQLAEAFAHPQVEVAVAVEIAERGPRVLAQVDAGEKALARAAPFDEAGGGEVAGVLEELQAARMVAGHQVEVAVGVEVAEDGGAVVAQVEAREPGYFLAVARSSAAAGVATASSSAGGVGKLAPAREAETSESSRRTAACQGGGGS